MKTCRKDFQGRKNTTVLKLLCRNIAAGRFNWRRYCTPQTYFGQEICVTPLIDEANESTSFSPPVMNNVSPLAGSCSKPKQ